MKYLTIALIMGGVTQKVIADNINTKIQPDLTQQVKIITMEQSLHAEIAELVKSRSSSNLSKSELQASIKFKRKIEKLVNDVIDKPQACI